MTNPTCDFVVAEIETLPPIPELCGKPATLLPDGTTRCPEHVRAQDPLMLTDMVNDHRGVGFTFGGADEPMKLLAESFLELLRQIPAENYIEFQLGHHAPEIVVTLQKLNRPTPHELRKKAEKERDDAIARAEKAEQELDELIDQIKAPDSYA